MRRSWLLMMLPVLFAAVPALAQPAAAPDANAPPAAFIDTALHALAAGRLAEAENAIEQAESRALTRAVRPSRADQPSQQPLVAQLSKARQALESGDRLKAVDLLETAAKTPDATDKE